MAARRRRSAWSSWPSPRCWGGHIHESPERGRHTTNLRPGGPTPQQRVLAEHRPGPPTDEGGAKSEQHSGATSSCHSQCSASHEDVAAFGRRRYHFELGGDRGFRNPAHLFGCGCRTGDGWAGFRRRTHLGPDGCEGDPEALDPVTEVRRRAHADLLTEGP